MAAKNNPRQILHKVSHNDFDPAIIFGRDQLLFVKREALDILVRDTRYSEDEIKNLKDLYVYFAEEKRGLNLDQFRQLFALFSKIDHHSMIQALFYL